MVTSLGLAFGGDELAQPPGDRVDAAHERIAVGGVDRAEQVGREGGVVGLHLPHHLVSGCRERDDDRTPIGRMRSPGDVAARLERIDEPGDVAGTHLEALGECVLRRRARGREVPQHANARGRERRAVEGASQVFLEELARPRAAGRAR